MYMGFFVLVFIIFIVVIQQVEECEVQCWFNFELCVMCVLLVEFICIVECMCIVCELYDLIGYYFIVFSLNFEVVSYLVNDKVVEYVCKVQVMVKYLLLDVCEVVSELCQDDVIDLIQVLCSLIEGVFGLDVYVQMLLCFSVEDFWCVQVLLCCVQEIIINIVCYVGVCNLWLYFVYVEDGMFGLYVCDDGCGVVNYMFGNGMSGMCECLVEFGGSVMVDIGVMQGFVLIVWLLLGEVSVLVYVFICFELLVLSFL